MPGEQDYNGRMTTPVLQQKIESAIAEGRARGDFRMPHLRRIWRQFRPAVKQLPLDERLALAEGLFASRAGSLAYIADCVLALSVPMLEPIHLSDLDRFLDTFDDWGITDDFCINVLQPLLERMPADVFNLLERWSVSENRWKRRASVVVFTRKGGAFGKIHPGVPEAL
jgi:hypothetical protein